ncbi:hypothetical protein EYC80_007033 [Monilinia laxa]|uniref:Uncharacterized protein n=1 Tax=Monilinia laxa TaxID=61186 RepID=A0A5N6JZY1_MONLA|nr:hypothetical protein EYC80_007033 [Monilinia laxa]
MSTVGIISSYGRVVESWSHTPGLQVFMSPGLQVSRSSCLQYYFLLAGSWNMPLSLLFFIVFVRRLRRAIQQVDSSPERTYVLELGVFRLVSTITTAIL